MSARSAWVLTHRGYWGTFAWTDPRSWTANMVGRVAADAEADPSTETNARPVALADYERLLWESLGGA